MKHLSTLVATLVLIVATSSSVIAQLDLEIVRMKSGRLVKGEVTEVLDDAFVLTRKVGSGSVTEKLRFSKIEPTSLYSTLAVLLAPLDGPDNVRLARVAFDGKLFATAARHYHASAEGAALSTELLSRIDECADHDIAHILDRSRTALDGEQFSRARRLADLAMRRYPRHDGIKDIPEYIASITRRYEAARKRDAMIARSRKEKRRWEKGEKTIESVQSIVDKALRAEASALSNSKQFRATKDKLDSGMKHLRSAETKALALRQSRAIPDGLRPKARDLEEQIIGLNIRLRLHVASMYTVRGSYGSALTYVNAALSYDPSDEQALDARARIEQAAALSGARFGRVLR